MSYWIPLRGSVKMGAKRRPDLPIDFGIDLFVWYSSLSGITMPMGMLIPSPSSEAFP